MWRQQALEDGLFRKGLFPKIKPLSMDIFGERDTPTSRVGLVKLDIRRNSLVFQRKDGFNDRAQTRCAFRMTYIRLESPDINMLNTN